MPAQDDLAAAEVRAGVQVRALDDPSELDDARAVFDAVWPAEHTQVPANLFRAMIHAGGYASGAYRDGVPIGAAFAFVGRHRTDHGWHGHLHSHMAAVLAPYRDQHIGAALKLHQREWALEHGLDTIVWTFDPLVRRNAVLNIVKLGVDVDGFEPNFYGNMDDGINSGDPTDRLFAWWRLDSPQVERAMRGQIDRMDAPTLVAAGRDAREIPLPDDIVELRATDRPAAAAWRVSLREELQSAFGAGYAIVGVSASGGYVLERKP